MSKSKLKEQLESFESYVNDIPLVIDPCRMCKNHDDNKGFSETCPICCWFYGSKFEVRKVDGQGEAGDED